MVRFIYNYKYSPNGKFKPFRITKKGIDTGVFEKIPAEINDRENSNVNPQRNSNLQNSQNRQPQAIRIDVEMRNNGDNNEINID